MCTDEIFPVQYCSCLFSPMLFNVTEYVNCKYCNKCPLWDNKDLTVVHLFQFGFGQTFVSVNGNTSIISGLVFHKSHLRSV